MGDKLQIEGNLAQNSYWDKTGKQLHIELKKVHFSDGSVLDTKFCYQIPFAMHFPPAIKILLRRLLKL